MKKTLAMLLALVMMLSMLSACGDSGNTPASNPPSNPTGSADDGNQPQGNEPVSYSPMKIAFAANAVDETFVEMKNAMENSIGPALNIEFMFSEAISDAGALTTFIENAYASGCDAVWTNVTSSIDQAAGVCEELGMYFVGISSDVAKENMSLEHYVSVTGASAAGYATAYGQALSSVVNDGKDHSVLILSGAACYGATSFIEGTVGSLQALADVYGLTYDEDLYALATSSTQVDATNSKGIKITVFPGMADMATNVSPLLQTGNYDVLCGTTNIYDSLGVAVDEVEKALGTDIKVISRAAFSDNIKAAFNGTDSQGSPIMDAIVLNGAYEHIAAVAILRNAFDGNLDNMRDNGQCSRVPGMVPLVVTNADEYNALSADNMPYCYTTIDDINAMIGSGATWQQINEFGASLTTENILAKFS